MKVVNWQILKKNTKNINNLVSELEINELTAKILLNRGWSKDEIGSLLSTKDLEDPKKLKDAQIVCELIRKAIDENKKIAIYGDYDCDGVTATAILYEYFLTLGADVIPYIPERKEGYGLSRGGIDYLKEKGVQLIITVDNGMTAFEEAQYLYSLGMELIITDHHKPGEKFPKSEAIVNPHRNDDKSEFKEICGCAVAFKLIAAMEDGDYETVFDFAGDLTAIATVGDIMPLIGENRTFVKRGLELVTNTNHIGLRALIDSLSLEGELTAQNLAFLICPKINAAGRLEDAKLAFSLLTCEDEEQSKELAQKLLEYNTSRQGLESKVLNDIKNQIEVDRTLTKQRILIFKGDDWDKGVIGIVAGKISKSFGKPVMIFAENKKEYVGSVRSIQDYSIFDALKSVEDILDKWGGHKLAGGLTIKEENLSEFVKRINKYAVENPPPCDDLFIDAVISKDDITLNNAQSIQLLEPFGSGNKKPVFMVEKAIIEKKYSLSDGKHVKLEVNVSGKTFIALYFGMRFERFYFERGDMIDLAVTLEINNFNNSKSVNLYIADIKPTGIEKTGWVEEYLEYEKFARSEKICKDKIDKLNPTRDEFALVYKKLKEYGIFYGDLRELYYIIYKDGIGLFRLSVILEVLRKNNLIKITTSGIEIVKNPRKINLMEDVILNKLRVEGVE